MYLNFLPVPNAIRTCNFATAATDNTTTSVSTVRSNILLVLEYAAVIYGPFYQGIELGADLGFFEGGAKPDRDIGDLLDIR